MVHKLADLLPHDGHDLLSRRTAMSHFCDVGRQTMELSGKGVNASFTVPTHERGTAPAEWFSDEKPIHLGG